MVPAALLAYALLTRLRPLPALGVLLFLIPFGHLVRFSVAGVPFTFPEAAVYVLAGVLAVQKTFSSFRAERSRVEARESAVEKSHMGAGTSHGVRSLGSGLGMTRWWDGMTTWWKDPWATLPLLWVLVAAIAAIGSPAGVRAWGIWKAYFLGPVLLFWIIRSLWGAHTHVDRPAEMQNAKCKMQNDWYVFVLPLALGAFLVAAIAILQRWWPIGVPYPWSVPGKFRATSVFGYPNAVGLFLGPLAPLCVGGAWEIRRRLTRRGAKMQNAECRMQNDRSRVLLISTFLFFTSAIAIVAIALARSTGALVALTVVLPVLILFSWHFHARTPSPPSHLKAPDAHFHDRRNRRLANGWAAGLIGAWVVTSLLLTLWLPYLPERPRWGPPIVQKLTFQKWSGSVRLSQYRETWALLRDHPIRGAGLAGYQTAIAPYHEKQDVEIFLYPHNLLLAIWVELGLAGLLIFLAIVYQFFRIALRLYGSTALRLASVASMLVILIHGLVDVPYFKNDLAMLFWVIAALAALDGYRVITYGRSGVG